DRLGADRRDPHRRAVLLSHSRRTRFDGDGALDGHGARDDQRADAAERHPGRHRRITSRGKRLSPSTPSSPRSDQNQKKYSRRDAEAQRSERRKTILSSLASASLRLRERIFFTLISGSLACLARVPLLPRPRDCQTARSRITFAPSLAAPGFASAAVDP